MALKDTYLSIKNDKQLDAIYEEVNKKINYVIDHGRLHVNHVISHIEMICKALKVDAETKYLALIAGALHDIGRLQSNEEHALFSAKFAATYLKNKLSKSQINTICEAIRTHETEHFNFSSTNDCAWILLLADKLDNKRSRFLPELMDEKAKTKPSYNINDYKLTRNGNRIVLTITFYKKRAENESILKTPLYKIFAEFFKHFNKDFKIVLI